MGLLGNNYKYSGGDTSVVPEIMLGFLALN